MKKLTLVFIILAMMLSLWAKYPAPIVDKNKSFTYISTLVGVYAGSVIYADKNTKRLESSKIAKLDTDDIVFFDEWAINDYDKDWDTTSDALLLIPALTTAFHVWNKGDILYDYGYVFSEILAGQLALNNWTKSLSRRERPYLYHGSPSEEEKDKYDNRMSFYSHHTSLAFAVSTYNYLYFSNENYSPSANLVLNYAPSVGVAVARVVSGKHFPSDVIVGAAMGSLVSYLTIKAHLPQNNLSLSLIEDKVTLSYKF